MNQQSTENAILAYFQNEGDLLSDETAVIGTVIREVVAMKGTVSNKDIILSLINRLESTTDVTQLDIYRKALEVVVGRTPDDV
ncbi:biofilm/acid-resistance regulator YmgB/AriR [Erwinia billingiae]|uniref:biofilm/acid-resistance regulator YmgB/AriR n=1 Tax=Erwinia TaxID=551 RepID=UPI00107101D9|nr:MULTISPECIES: biofilm/acid-resistance regulator YmgB/AriR [Erwinia]QBR52291.1 transcriptional regulator [Erwinia sp. QL-Z3]QEW31638.1 transcriptional regulator [Erwinia billingiae]